jgi:hypothetical protein
VAGCCEHGNELSCSKKKWEIYWICEQFLAS